MLQDFSTWWNKTQFRTKDHPLYDIFKSLHAAKADIEYLQWLCWCFFFWEKREKTKQSLTEPKKKTTPVVSVGEENVKPLLLFASNLIEFTLEYLKEYRRVDATLDPLTLIPSEARRKLISDVAIYTSGADLWVPFIQSATEAFKEHRMDLQAEESRKERELLRQVPFLKLVKEYQPAEKDTGRKPDTWAAFFLLAVSEHLREKSRKPDYLKAETLLERLRTNAIGPRLAKAPSSLRAKRQKATVRVEQLKKAHPEWPSHVKLLKQCFMVYKKRKGNSPAGQSPSFIPWWLEDK
ncbi:MAG: hypothetical protein HY695_25550 [Deltaproteobacteria bacterium]|nr:hypothetical protein [Deltaproteobacteria bacterium]